MASSSSSRNLGSKILPGMGLSPVPARGGVKTTQGSMPKEYQDAVSVLSVENMNTACQLLLGCGNGSGKSNDAETNISQLQEMYYKAEAAAQVVATQQPKLSMMMQNQKRKQGAPGTAPSLSNLSGGVSSAAILRGTSLKPKLGDFKLPTGGIKHGLKGSAAVMRGRTGIVGSMRGMPNQHQKRAQSMPPSLMHQNKKQRISPTTIEQQQKVSKSAKKAAADDGNTTPTISTAPPPSALSFLAKLNRKKDTNNDRDTSMGSQEQAELNEREESSSSEDDDEDDASPTVPDPNPNARRNPRRGGQQQHPNRK